MKTLFLLRGLPGSGKSTLAAQLWNKFVHFEADKFWYDSEGKYNFDIKRLNEAHKWCQDQVETAMKDSKVNSLFYTDIVVSNTLTTEKELAPYLALAEKYGYRVVSLIVENRHGNSNIHNVPEETLKKMKERFEVKLI